MKIRLSRIRETATDRPAGYTEDVISRGEVSGDWLEIPDSEIAILRTKYRPQPDAPAPPTTSKGLGDVVHKIAQPIARVIDRMAGTRIQTCGGCAQRRAALNQAFPFSTKPTP